MKCILGNGKTVWQVLKNYIEQGRMDGLLVCDLPQIRGNCLTCLPSAGQWPDPGTSILRVHRGKIDQTDSEAIYGEQPLISPTFSFGVSPPQYSASTPIFS